MAAGRFEEAVPIYRDLVRAVPDNPGLIMNLGLALHMAGQDRQAIPHFEAALNLEPSLFPANLFLGASYLRLGEPARAIGPLEKAVHSEPGNKDARRLLADALYGVKRFEDATQHYAKLSELDPKDPQIWFKLGLSYEALSVHAFEELEKLALESAYWFALVADSRVSVRQFGSAFYFYRKALAQKSAMRGVHAALAQVYRETGHPDWAATEEDRERQLGPPDCSSSTLECQFLEGRYLELVESAHGQPTVESWYWRVRAYNQLALQALSRLTQLPPSPEAHALLAEIHRNQRRPRESVEEWKKALELSPGNPWLQQGLAISLRMAGDHTAARPILEGLLKQEPDSAELNFLLGDTLLDLQKVEEALPFLRKAVERDPALLAAHSSLARAYLQIGQGQQATPHLKAALSLDEDGSLHYQLARAYQSSGQPELAREMLSKYQEITRLATEVKKTLTQEFEITPP